jgi:hypothetical protein
MKVVNEQVSPSGNASHLHSGRLRFESYIGRQLLRNVESNDPIIVNNVSEIMWLWHNLMYFFPLVAPTFVSLLPLLEHRAEFPQFLNQGQSVGLLGRVIS